MDDQIVEIEILLIPLVQSGFMSDAEKDEVILALMGITPPTDEEEMAWENAQVPPQELFDD